MDTDKHNMSGEITIVMLSFIVMGIAVLNRTRKIITNDIEGVEVESSPPSPSSKIRKHNSNSNDEGLASLVRSSSSGSPPDAVSTRSRRKLAQYNPPAYENIDQKHIADHLNGSSHDSKKALPSTGIPDFDKNNIVLTTTTSPASSTDKRNRTKRKKTRPIRHENDLEHETDVREFQKFVDNAIDSKKGIAQPQSDASDDRHDDDDGGDQQNVIAESFLGTLQGWCPPKIKIQLSQENRDKIAALAIGTRERKITLTSSAA